MERQRQEEAMRNGQMKQQIKTQEQEAIARRQEEAEVKRLQKRQELMQKIIAENKRRMEAEAEVARLEQLELELIQKLQNTQVMQKTAYDDLENALNGNIG